MASTDTSVVFLLLKTGSHRHAVMLLTVAEIAYVLGHIPLSHSVQHCANRFQIGNIAIVRSDNFQLRNVSGGHDFDYMLLNHRG